MLQIFQGWRRELDAGEIHAHRQHKTGSSVIGLPPESAEVLIRSAVNHKQLGCKRVTRNETNDQVLLAVRVFASVARPGTADMSALVEATSRLPLLNLDRWERLIRWELSYLAIEAVKKHPWRTFWNQGSPFLWLTWVDLCAGDGFRRERALRVLFGAAPNRFFLAMAVRRLNDWVHQVREAANERLLSIANASAPEDVADVLCAVLPHRNSWGRMDENSKQTLHAIISIDAVVNILRSRIISTASGPMAAILAQAGQTPALDKYLREIANSAIQPSVRAKAYQCLLDGKIVWLAGRKRIWTDIRYCKSRLEPVFCNRPLTVASPFEETLQSASSDRSPIVRRIAGSVLVREWKQMGAFAFTLAEALSLDADAAVAAKGKYVLKALQVSADA